MQRDQRYSTAAIDRLLRPRSIAVVGASATPKALGASVLANLDRAKFNGSVHLVNPNRTEIGGRPCIASIDKLPDSVDCAVLAIPRAGVLDAVSACAKRGVGGVIIFSAGFAETGAEGRAVQDRIRDISTEHGMIIEGPNCLGMVNYVEGIPLTFVPTELKLLGSALLPDLAEDRIRGYIKARLAEKASGRTINMEVGELSRALGNKWSVLWPKMRKLEENHDAGQALSPEDESLLLTTAAQEDPNRDPSLYPFLCIALSTGMRSGEIKSLRWFNVALDRSVITVGRAKTQKGKGRQIPINPDMVKVFEDHARWYIRKIGEIKPDWYVFPGRAGKVVKGERWPLDPTKPIGDMTTAWDTLRERSGVHCRLHDLRHTAATKMAEAGAPESTMLAIMGHMSRAMLERYSHIRMAAKRESVKSLELPKVGPRLVSTPMSKGRQSQMSSNTPKAVND